MKHVHVMLHLYISSFSRVKLYGNFKRQKDVFLTFIRASDTKPINSCKTHKANSLWFLPAHELTEAFVGIKASVLNGPVVALLGVFLVFFVNSVRTVSVGQTIVC